MNGHQSSAAGDAGFVTKPSLTVKRRLNAPPAKVYAAWTDPEKNSSMVCTRECQDRFGAGGHRRADRRPLPHQLLYRRRVLRSRRRLSRGGAEPAAGVQLGVAFDAGTRIAVTISLKPDGDGTLLTLHHEQFFDSAARDSHERGWTGMLDKLEKYIA